jgi:hypothetical protein
VRDVRELRDECVGLEIWGGVGTHTVDKPPRTNRAP